MKTISYLLALGLVGTHAYILPSCPGSNTTYECIQHCTPTCDEPGLCSGLVQTNMCKPGCRCNWGYVVSKTGDCVLPKDCPGSGFEEDDW
ncbi:hypothetical protein ASPFODRAFT_42942 [Aspergillus luchuensis CBS 106.47]|uniref:TIL domain-containing protein n=1 Tax=Aspergillus luchuensis (strain CBS 106.47) TaxID=1137211 RepID=A0A1M3TSI6_ASPLC|nr:hypothetical protein ASPFODRAFT_42942 [Aspergillus luchuensis CBS 106.47]